MLTSRTIAVTDYGDENPLHFDYHGFPAEFFKLKFKSRGDSQLATRIVDLYNKVCDVDPPWVPPALTYVSQGRVDRQDHTAFGASWRGWSGGKVSRSRPWCLHSIPTHVWGGDGDSYRGGFN